MVVALMRANGGAVVPVLAYHEVSAQSERRKKVRTMGADCSILRERFAVQLAVLKEGGFETSTSFDRSFFIGTAGLEPKPILITFDDGHAGNYLHAFPLLSERGFSGVFFVTTDFLGRTGMMTWENLREMARHGMSIQSHCVSHTPLETLSEGMMREELRISKLLIEEATASEVRVVSLPHGSHHPKLQEAALSAGYTHVCTSLINFFHPSETTLPIFVPRIPVPDTLTVKRFREVVGGGTATVDAWRRRQSLKAALKRTLGINNYRWLYRMVHRIEI